MRLKLFGSPALLRDGVPTQGQAAQRRRLGLLMVLAVAGRDGVSRDRLVALLWPDTDETKGKASLAQALYAIRKELGEDAIEGTTDLRLGPTIASDVSEFLQAVEEGDDLSADKLRAGPFLDGFQLPGLAEFERWQEQQRERFEQQWVALVERRARAAEARGDWAEAVAQWRRLAGHDPLSGRFARALVLALMSLGDRESALRQLRIHAELLQSELGLRPDGELRALEKELLLPQPTGEVRSPVARTPAGTPATAAAPPLPPPAPAASPAVATAPAPTPPEAPAAPRRRVHPLALIGPAVAIVASLLVVVLGTGRRDRTAERDLFTPLAATSAPVLALGAVTADSSAAPTARLIAEMLATGLAQLPGVEVVASSRLRELIPDTATDSARALADAARRAGAVDLVEGTLARRPDDRYRLDVRLVALADGKVRATARGEGADPLALVDEVTGTLARALQVGAPAQSLGEVSTKSLVAWQFYEEGMRAWQDGRAAGARLLFERALAEDSTFALAAFRASWVAGDRAAEIRTLERARRLARHASPREALLIRAAWANAVDDPSRRAVAESLVAAWPADLEARVALAEALLWNGETAPAIAQLRHVVRADAASIGPGQGQARCLGCEALGRLQFYYLMADSVEQALAVGRASVRRQPTDAPAWSRLAETLMAAGRTDELRGVLDTVAQLDARRAAGLRLLHAVREGDLAGISLELPRLRLDTARAARGRLHWTESRAWREMGRPRDALAPAIKARLLVQDEWPAGVLPAEATLEAIAAFEAGDLARAAAVWDSMGRRPDPREPPSLQARHRVWFGTLAAEARAAGGDTTGLAQLADSFAIDGQRSAYGRDRRLHHHLRGLLHQARGEDAQAIAEFRQAIFSPVIGFTRTNLHLARLLAKAGRREEAATLLRQALRGNLDGANLYVARRLLRAELARLTGAG
ncbi:MAG: BTAD domain-containing putative transcriptional regulator [Gemmatimonadales bacterium]|nr:BTAD domain-containing putative transcriptional regulator [Gemmatimonadales bacterium]